MHVKGHQHQTFLDSGPSSESVSVFKFQLCPGLLVLSVEEGQTSVPGAAGSQSSLLCTCSCLWFWSVISEEQLGVSLDRTGPIELVLWLHKVVYTGPAILCIFTSKTT